MAYSPLTWVEKSTKVGPTNMNHLELGLQAAAAVADAALPTPAGTNGQFLKKVGGVWVPTSFAASDIPNYPSDGTVVLLGDGTWGRRTYRKTSSKQVVNSVTETDLLNGEITVAANALGTTGVLRLTAWGDWKQNSGGATDAPRFKLKLGSTTFVDTGTFGGSVAPNSATRFPWRLQAEIANLGAANSQWATLAGDVLFAISSVLGAAAVSTGEGDIASIMTNGTQSVGEKIHASNSGAVDTTAAQALVLSVILPATNASLDITLKSALVEVV